MMVGRDVRHADEIDLARVDDDQLRTLAQAPLHARGEHRMAVGRVGADHQDHVAFVDRIEILRAGRGAERRPQAVAGRRVADAGAGVDIVVAERGADQLLDDEHFLVGATGGSDAADRAAAVFGLDALQPLGRMADRLVPGHDPPRLVDRFPDHGLGHPVLVGRVAPGEAALDAGMAVIGLAVLMRRHAHDPVALQLGLERAADAAIGAGRDHARGPAGHASTTDFSTRVAVGQACTQAPHDTHSESRKSSSMPADTWLSNPRPPMVSAKVP